MPSVAPSTTVIDLGRGRARSPRAPSAAGAGRARPGRRRCRRGPRPGRRRGPRLGQQRRVGGAAREVEPQAVGAGADQSALARGQPRRAASRGRRCRRGRATRPGRYAAAPARRRLTVAGLTPSSAATSRTVGSRSPGASSPARMARPKTPAIPCGVRSVSVARSGERSRGPLRSGRKFTTRRKA